MFEEICFWLPPCLLGIVRLCCELTLEMSVVCLQSVDCCLVISLVFLVSTCWFILGLGFTQFVNKCLMLASYSSKALCQFFLSVYRVTVMQKS